MKNDFETTLEHLYHGFNDVTPISRDAWCEATPYFKHHVLVEGEHLFEMEDRIEDIYFVMGGLLRFYYLTEAGKEFNKSFVTKADVISSISSIVLQEPSPFYVQALSDCSLISIAYDDFSQLTKKSLEFSQLTICMLEKLAITKEQREADFLLLDATARYKKFLIHHAGIKDKLTNYHIASYLGITEVALSRIRRSMGLT